MYTWSLYRLEDGLFTGHVIASDDPGHKDRNLTADLGAVEGHHDHLSRRVDLGTGEVIEYQPPAPSADHEWNATTKRWQLSDAAQAKAAAHAAARQRITALEAQSGPLVRKAALGDVNAIARLRSIDDEITQLLGPVELPQGARGPAPPGE